MTEIPLKDLKAGDHFKFLPHAEVYVVQHHGRATTTYAARNEDDPNDFHIRSDYLVTPVPPGPLAELEEVWINVYDFLLLVDHASAAEADADASGKRVGRCKLDLSTWVPCDGKEVLS